MVGYCKVWKDDKGYGFIEGQDGNNYYVYYKSVLVTGKRRLKEGDEVEFDTAPPIIPGKRNQAVNVNILN